MTRSSFSLHGALLIDKSPGLTSFAIVEELKHALLEKSGCQKSELPKLGHGGTLDPFATGLLVVLIGDAVKLARYFLGANKGYEGIIKFGETTIPGDPTAPISERSENLPQSAEVLSEMATRLTAQAYLQTPPMHSAKKHKGKPLYELAREGIEVEREPKLCHLHRFDIHSYEAPRAEFALLCSSGTYVRTLAQDFARLLGSVALLESLRRTHSGVFSIKDAMSLEAVQHATAEGIPWDELTAWVPFDFLLAGYDRAEATEEESHAIAAGRQSALFNILRRTRNIPANSDLPSYPNRESCLAIYHSNRLVAVARNEEQGWKLERVFSRFGSVS